MPASTLRIAVIEPVGGHGGMDYYDFGLCSGLAAAECDVVLHTSDETQVPLDTGFVVLHTYSGIYGKGHALLRGVRYVRASISAIWSAYRDGRFICHFHLFHVGPLEAFNITLAKIFRRKIVITAHDVESFVDKLEVPALSRWVYRQASCVIAHNKISQRELIRRIGISDEKIKVIPHGNYVHALRPLPSRIEACKMLGIPLSSKVLLFFGQIKEVKGLHILLDAMPSILALHPETVLLIAGKPWKSDFEIYEEKIRQLGIDGHCIRHIRYIPDHEVPLYYASADMVVLPYQRIYQSGVVLMAMSYGKTVLVSSIDGMLEVVQDQDTGYTFMAGNVDDLTSKVNLIFNNAAAAQKVAARGRRLMDDRYNWLTIAKMTKVAYENLV